MNPSRICALGVAAALATAALAQVDGPIPLAWRWLQSTSVSPEGAPVVTGDTVHVAVGSRIYALDRTTGNLQWRYPVGLPLQGQNFDSGIVDVGDGVAAATDAGAFYCVNKADGSLRWSYNSPEPVIGRPVATKDAIVFQLQGNRLNAISIADGQPYWAEPFEVGQGLRGNMTSYEGSVIFFTDDSRMRSLDVATQRLLWDTQFQRLSSTVDATVFGDRIYVVAGRYIVSVFAVTGGSPRQRAVGDELVFSPAVSDTGVAVVSRDGLVYTFNLNLTPIFPTGVDLQSQPIQRPTFVGTQVVVPTYNGAINMIDPISGVRTWRFIVPSLREEEEGSAAAAGGGRQGGGSGMVGGAGGGADMGDAGGGRSGGGQQQVDIPDYVVAAGPLVASDSTLLMLAHDGSLLAFDETFGVDLTPPTVKMLFPTPGSIVGGNAPGEIWFSVSDAASGVNGDTLKVTVGGVPYASELLPSGHVRVVISATGPNRPLSQGRKAVTITIADWMGNYITKEYALTIDNTVTDRGIFGVPKRGMGDEGGAGGSQRRGGGGMMGGGGGGGG